MNVFRSHTKTAPQTNGTPSSSHHKLVPLDAIRGIAALVVFCGHFCEGLFPHVTSYLNGSPFFFILNGPSAVVIFFVLSGFVLTIHPLQSRSWGRLATLSVKRWPRLAGPVLISGMAISVLALSGAFPLPEHIPQSLQGSGPVYSLWGQSWGDGNVRDVLEEAAFGTFFIGTAQHNPVWWTMHWELLGSFLVFGLTAASILNTKSIIKVAIFLAIWISAWFYNFFLIAFPFGVLGAIFHQSYGHRVRMSNRSATCLTLVSLVTLSWDSRVKTGMWAWTGILSKLPRMSAWVLADSLAALSLMAVALYHPVISRYLVSRLGIFAGRISFSFYLMHLPILCSVTAWAYIWTSVRIREDATFILMFLLSLSVSLIAAYPLMIFDQWWIRILGRLSKMAMPRSVLRNSR